MKILIIGSGCREHALAWKFSLSEKAEKIYIAPGNGGTALENKCENVPLHTTDLSLTESHNELLAFAKNEKINLTVVGPEVPLAHGITDIFRSAGLGIIGPDQKAAQLETSKIYSKKFMYQYGVRTAKCKIFTDADAAAHYAEGHFKTHDFPLVIKADGLAAGKGVVVACNAADAEETLLSFMKNGSLGKAGKAVVIEEFLEGNEVSILAAVSVKNGKGEILPFITARDHKRRFDGGQGPNTGGMGAIAPVPDFSATAQKDFFKAILKPTLKGIIAENLDYRGFIFFGLMVHKSRCRLLEYNVRLGDPETEAVLPLMDSDLCDLCTAILDGTLEGFPLIWKSGAVCSPVAVADSYPGSCRKGDVITIDKSKLEKSGAKIFYGGVASKSTGELITNGGRVLNVSAYGKDADDAFKNAYQGLAAVSFDGMSFRNDIGREKITANNA